MLKKFLIGTFAVAALAFAMSASAAYDFGSATLRVGSKGAGVMAVQTVVGATVDGSFGPMTAAAVKAWQAANGLTADGVFGPMSMAKANAGATVGTYPAGCTSAVGYSSTTGQKCSTTVSTGLPAGCTSTAGYSATTGAKCDGSTTGGTVNNGVLGNGEGDIDTVNEVASADSNVKEGEEAELFAFTAEVDGDVSIDRVDFYLDNTDADSTDADAVKESENADDYFKSASLYVDGTKVATVDVGDFTESTYAKVDVVTGDADEYRIRFSGLNLVFNDGDEPKFVLAFDAVSNIESADIAETWGVELVADSIRFVDGRGFSGTAGAALEESFSASAEDIAKLVINSSSNDPDLTTFEVSSTTTTDDVVVFKFDIDEQNDVDVTIEDMTITLTTTTGDESAVVTAADLYNGSTLLSSENVTANTGVVTYTNLGLEIDGDDSVELTLKLTFADNSAYTEGEVVTAVVTSIDEATDANGNDEGDMTISGTGLSSKSHILRSTGMSVDVVSATTNISIQDGATNDIAEFVWVLDISAFGDSDVYINSKAANILTSDGAEANTVYTVGSSAASSLAAASLSATMIESDSDVTEVTADTEWTDISDGDDTFFKINKGTTGTFTLTVTGTNETAAKQVRGLLSNIEWTTKDVTVGVAEALAPNDYTSNLGVDAATPFKAIN